MVERTSIEIRTEDGVAEAHLARPAGDGPFPAVLMYMDAVGFRPTMKAMADRVASQGYVVLLPNLYYRAGELEPFDAKAVFGGDASERERLRVLVEGLDGDTEMRDTSAWLEALAARPEARPGPVGCVGYCMGGGFALLAACRFPDRVAAVASFHGGMFVTDPSAPDIVAERVKAAVYLGVAEVDRSHDAEVSARLEAALTRAGVPHAIELYEGATHGYAVPDLPVYDEAASERHYARMAAWLGEHLG